MRLDSNQGPDSIAIFLLASCYNLKLSIGGDRIIIFYRNGVDYLDNVLVNMDSFFTNLVLRLLYTKRKQNRKKDEKRQTISNKK